MKLVAELIKIKNQSPDKYTGFIETKNNPDSDLKFNLNDENSVYAYVVKKLKEIYSNIGEFQKSSIASDEQIKNLNKIMKSLDEFDYAYNFYNILMNNHKRVFNETNSEVAASERSAKYNSMKQNKNNLIVNFQLVLSKFIDVVKTKPYVNLDIADLIISKMEESFQLSAERELYVETKVSHRKHSHKAL